MSCVGTIIFIATGVLGEGEKIEAIFCGIQVLLAVGFGPAEGSSFRTKSGSRTKSGHLQFIPDGRPE